jgi:type VI secretion system protein ImpE
MNAQEHLEAGNLRDALAAATEEVRKQPADTAKRIVLCELLCFAGDMERADKQLDALGQLAPEATLGVALFRQLLRGEQARRQFFTDGRLPEFLDRPAPPLQLHLQASICLREGKPGEAATLLTQAEEQRPKPRGTCDGQTFDDFRDADDLTAPILEVITSNGKYYWVPLDQVELLELRPPQRLRDLLWRQAHLIVRNSQDGEVYVPTLYAGSHTDPDDRIRLGRYTDWRGGSGTPVRGVGLRTYLVGDAGRTILEIQKVTTTV